MPEIVNIFARFAVARPKPRKAGDFTAKSSIERSTDRAAATLSAMAFSAAYNWSISGAYSSLTEKSALQFICYSKL